MCFFGALPTRVYAQAANDPIFRDEIVVETEDGVVAGVLNGVAGVAKDSARALEAEARRDAMRVESLPPQRTPTPAPDSDESIGRDIQKLETLSQE